jgi:ArsR family transcriptional regulator, arsenate/arsenite/antimonite-responsive transcriptional repressor
MRCVCGLSASFDLTRPAISQVGLLTSERRASWMHYRVVPEAVTRLSALPQVPAGAAR